MNITMSFSSFFSFLHLQTGFQFEAEAEGQGGEEEAKTAEEGERNATETKEEVMRRPL